MNYLFKLFILTLVFGFGITQTEAFASEKNDSELILQGKNTKKGTITKSYKLKETIGDQQLTFEIYLLEDGYALWYWGTKSWNIGDEVSIDNPFSKDEYDHDKAIFVANHTNETKVKFYRFGFTTLAPNRIVDIKTNEIDEDEKTVEILLDNGTICSLHPLGDDKMAASTWQVGERVAVFIDIYEKDPYKAFLERDYFNDAEENCMITLINLDSKEHFQYETDSTEIRR